MPSCIGVACLSACVGAMTACSLLFDDPADHRPCAGLSLLHEEFTEDLDSDKWWTNTEGDASFSLQQAGLHLTTGQGQSARGAAFGTHDYLEAQGTLAIEIASLDVDIDSSFFVRLDASAGNSVSMSISGGALSLVGTDNIRFAPEYPVWLALSLGDGTAVLSTSPDGRDFIAHMQQPFSAPEVTVTVGLAAGIEDPAERTVTLGSIGSMPAVGCID